MQLTGKLMNQTWENGEKPNFGPDFGLFGPNLGPKYCCKLSLNATSRKRYDPHLVLSLIKVHWAQIQAAKNFSQKSGFVNH